MSIISGDANVECVYRSQIYPDLDRLHIWSFYFIFLLFQLRYDVKLHSGLC